MRHVLTRTFHIIHTHSFTVRHGVWFGYKNVTLRQCIYRYLRILPNTQTEQPTTQNDIRKLTNTLNHQYVFWPISEMTQVHWPIRFKTNTVIELRTYRARAERAFRGSGRRSARNGLLAYFLWWFIIRNNNNNIYKIVYCSCWQF